MPGSVPPAAGRAARVGLKLAVKYGPQAAVAWKLVGSHAVDATSAQVARRQDRRHAIDQARTLVDGSVLRTRQGTQTVWLVFSGPEAVAAYPDAGAGFEALVRHVDLAKRRTPDEIDAARLATRSRRLLAERAGSARRERA